jgi:hypothetical protein
MAEAEYLSLSWNTSEPPTGLVLTLRVLGTSRLRSGVSFHTDGYCEPVVWFPPVLGLALLRRGASCTLYPKFTSLTFHARVQWQPRGVAQVVVVLHYSSPAAASFFCPPPPSSLDLVALSLRWRHN